MSNRAVRKLHGGKDDLSTLAMNLQLDDEPEEVDSGKKKKAAVNLFDLVLQSCPYFETFNVETAFFFPVE